MVKTKTGTKIIPRNVLQDEKCLTCGYIFNREDWKRQEIDKHTAIESDEPLPKGFIYSPRESKFIQKGKKLRGLYYVIADEGEIASGLDPAEIRERYQPHTHMHRRVRLSLEYPIPERATPGNSRVIRNQIGSKNRLLGYEEFKRVREVCGRELKKLGIEDLLRSPIPGLKVPVESDTNEFEKIVERSF